MLRISSLIFACLIAFSMTPTAHADTTKLDNVAACAGVVLGNGAIDFFIGDEMSFDDAAEIAYTAYLAEAFAGGHTQSDLQIADQILGGNMDKVIAAYNSDTFDNELYEEVVGCYRMLALDLINNHEIISAGRSSWEEIKDMSISTIKRMLRAG